MPNDLFLDFETYSEVDIEEGSIRYAYHESTMPVCLTYGYEQGPVSLWTPDLELPLDVLDHVASGKRVYAHNAVFDWLIWNVICVREFGWPRLALAQLVDTQALAQAYSLPGSLDKACKAMNTAYVKSKGLALIKRCCMPQPVKKGRTVTGYRQPGPWVPEDKPFFDKLYAYGVDDTKAMRSLVQCLPRQDLIPQEKKIWLLTADMNLEGLPCDKNEINSIVEGIEVFQEEKSNELKLLTGGRWVGSKIVGEEISTARQYAKIKTFCATHGYPIKNCQGDYLRDLIADVKAGRINMPEKVFKLLVLCEILGKASTAKYKAFKKNMTPNRRTADESDYRVYNTFCYHGTSTGRWAGRGIQPQNFPRAQSKDPDGDIAKFIRKDYISDPIDLAKHLVRSMIKAPEGYVLLVADYSSIENRGLALTAGDTNTLEQFGKEYCQYTDMAAARYGESYERIYEGYLAEDPYYTELRRMGKVIILGCGYGMGKDTFKRTAWEQFRLRVSLEEADQAVRAYRARYPLVVNCWKQLKNAALRAVLTGQRTTFNIVTFGTFTMHGTKWLAMKLASGKCIYYHSPRVEDRLVPGYEHMGPTPTITFMGMHSKTHKWTRLPLIPGTITNNAVQGLCREAMATGMLNASERIEYLKVIGTVHDEAVSLYPENRVTDTTLDEYNAALCDVPFMKGCPIKAVGYISKRYKKG